MDGRAERAEAEAAQRVRRHAEVVAAERRADKGATLQRLAHFQQQLDTAVQQFKVSPLFPQLIRLVDIKHGLGFKV